MALREIADRGGDRSDQVVAPQEQVDDRAVGVAVDFGPAAFRSRRAAPAGVRLPPRPARCVEKGDQRIPLGRCHGAGGDGEEQEKDECRDDAARQRPSIYTLVHRRKRWSNLTLGNGPQGTFARRERETPGHAIGQQLLKNKNMTSGRPASPSTHHHRDESHCCARAMLFFA